MKAKVRFIEVNRRLQSRKQWTYSINISEKDFETYDVGGMIKKFEPQVLPRVPHDSDIIIKTIKVGRTEFQIA